MKHVAVFGFNRLSMEVVSRLNPPQYDLVIIEQDLKQLALAKEQGLNAYNIDFRNDEELKSIGIGSQIDTLLCFFERDSDNVFLTLSARAIDKKLNIISVVESAESSEKLIAAGANKIIDPYEICGRKIYDILKRPDITDILDHTVFGQHDLHMAEVLIPEKSFLLGVSLHQLRISLGFNLILIGIVNTQISLELNFVVEKYDRCLNVGDILVILGPSRDIEAFKNEVEK